MSKRNAKQYPVEQVENCDGSARYEQAADGTITITLTGRIAANLHRAAAAMNTVPWCDDDNTACDVLANFVFWQQMLNWGETGKHHFLNGLADEIGLIEDSIDTGAGDDKELDKKRKDELKAAFAKAFKFCESPLMAKATAKAK